MHSTIIHPVKMPAALIMMQNIAVMDLNELKTAFTLQIMTEDKFNK